MSNYIPKIDTHSVLTRSASADVVGGQLVDVSGSKTVAPAAADSAAVLGVALSDAKTGQAVSVSLGGVQRPVADGEITAGVKVFSAVAGKVSAKGTSNPIGIALETATSGAQVEIQMAR